MNALVSVPFGKLGDRVATARYQWSCDGRGDIPFVIIQASEAGAGEYVKGGRTWEVETGSAFVALVPERARYGFPEAAAEAWQFSWLNLYGELATAVCREFRGEFGPVVRLPEENGLGGRFRDLVRAGTVAGSAAADPFRISADAYSFLMDWWAYLRRPRLRASEAAEVLRGHIERRYYEPVNVKSLAGRYGVSREHLTRIFVAEYGESPAAALRARRGRAAQELMVKSRLPLAEVARRCGFSDVRQLRRALDG